MLEKTSFSSGGSSVQRMRLVFSDVCPESGMSGLVSEVLWWQAFGLAGALACWVMSGQVCEWFGGRGTSCPPPRVEGSS